MSVRDAAEARVACEFGASIVDVKEPNFGSLGRADWSAIDEVARTTHTCDAAIPVSVALGELAEADISDAATWRDRLGDISFAKLGLARAPDDWRTKWESIMSRLPLATQRVAVAYADWEKANSPEPSRVIKFAAAHDCRVVLIDTFCKTNGGLFDVLSEPTVRSVIEQIRERGMMSAMAGSLDIASVERLLPMAPDIIGVRGAVCCGERTSTIDAGKVRNLTRAISDGAPSPAGK